MREWNNLQLVRNGIGIGSREKSLKNSAHPVHGKTVRFQS
jgi:hypothetical protein